MEQELRSLLATKADAIRADRARRSETLRTARRRRSFVAATSLLGIAAVAMVSLSMAGPLRGTNPEPRPPIGPSDDEFDEDEVETTTRLAEAADGSWVLSAGESEDGETLCFSLNGGLVCGRASPRSVTVFTQSSNDMDAFIYGLAGRETAVLTLTTDDDVINLRLRDLPAGFGPDEVRFFVRRMRRDDTGVLVARDARGGVLQRTEIGWGVRRTIPEARDKVAVRSFVEQFTQRRLAGSGAERHLAPGGTDAFGDGGSLSPLYPDARPEGFEIVFVDDLGDGSYEVGVSFNFEGGSVGHTLFIDRDGGRFLITGGRRGLEGP